MESIIASIILTVIMGCIIGLAAYKTYKENKKLTIDEFLDMYYDNKRNADKNNLASIS